MKNKFEADICCQSCGGTGLYNGMGEKEGCAVVCYTCKGTGKFHYIFKYEKFKKRKIVKDIKRVFKQSFGYCHGPDDIVTKEGKEIRFSKAGCSYKEWLKGIAPKPVEELYCPFIWENQVMQEKEDKYYPLYDARCCKNILSGSRISDCKYNCDKTKCWEIYYKIAKEAK